MIAILADAFVKATVLLVLAALVTAFLRLPGLLPPEFGP